MGLNRYFDPISKNSLFSDHYIRNILPSEPIWKTIKQNDVLKLKNFIEKLYRKERKTLATYNEAQLEFVLFPVIIMMGLYSIYVLVKNEEALGSKSSKTCNLTLPQL